MPSSDIVPETAASMASTFAGASAPGGPMTWAPAGEARRARTRSARLTRLLQPIPVLELLRQVLFRDEADAPAGERFQLELLPAPHHLLDLALPVRLLEPRVGEHLLGPVVVAVVHLDGDVVRELVLVLVERGQADEARVGHGHAHRLVGQVDRALLHDAVDVEAPGVVVDQHVDGQLQFVVKALYEPPHSPRRLALALDDDAVVALPELVLVEARPDSVLFDEQDKLGLVFAERDDVLFDDGGDAPAPGPHPAQVDGVAGVDDRDGSDHRARARSKEVKLFAQ